MKNSLLTKLGLFGLIILPLAWVTPSIAEAGGRQGKTVRGHSSKTVVRTRSTARTTRTTRPAKTRRARTTTVRRSNGRIYKGKRVVRTSKPIRRPRRPYTSNRRRTRVVTGPSTGPIIFKRPGKRQRSKANRRRHRHRRYYRHHRHGYLRSGVYVGAGYYGPGYHRTGYALQPQGQAPALVQSAPPPPLLRLGVGATLGSTNNGDEINQVSGVSVRYRVKPAVEIGVELSKTSNENDEALERRAGATLTLYSNPYARLSPFLMAGLGTTEQEGASEAAANYAEVGAGVLWRVNPQLALTLDYRVGSQDEYEKSQALTRSTGHKNPDNSQEYARTNVSAILYF